MNEHRPPSIFVVYPSFYYYPAWLQRDEVKASQLVLASYLSKHFPVQYDDFEMTIGRPSTEAQIRRFDRRVRDNLANREFDILAISCWTSLSYKTSLTIARAARESHPNSLIVVGGYHPTARPEDFVTPEHLFDYVIRGEGEVALAEIAQSFPTAGRPKETQIVVSPPLQPEQFADMNWNLIEGLVRENCPDGVGTLCLYLSRGCPFECSFCMETLKDHAWRPYTPEKAIEQMKRMDGRFKFTALGIGDACFGANARWRKEFLERLVDYNPSYYVLFETRPEFLDEGDIKLMSKLKIELQLGVESCSPRMLRVMKKTRQPEKFLEDFRRTSHRLSEHGIVHGANLIFNHPGETQESIEETFRFIDAELDWGVSSLMWTCHGYMHFPGSEVERNAAFYEKEYGTVFMSPEWWHEDRDPFAAAREVVPSRDLTGERMELWNEMFRERLDRIKDSLTEEAFQIAAGSYYPSWQADRRYRRD